MKILHKYSRGQMFVIMTMVLGTLIGAMALCTDVLMIYFHYVRIQKAADAGALAGALEFARWAPNPPPTANGCPGAPEASSTACTYATYNGAAASEITVNVPAPIVPAVVPAGAQTLQVVINRTDIPVYFLRVLGRTQPYAVKAYASAVGPTAINQVGNGLFPLGMPYNPNGGSIDYGAPVTLNEKVSPGNWEWLDITNGEVGSSTSGEGGDHGGGNSLLATNIEHGCTCSFRTGDYVTPEPGNKSHSAGVNSALGALGVEAGNDVPVPQTLTGNEPRLVTVPVVDWSESEGASKQVKILGFAVVWIENWHSGGPITVDFVKFQSRYATAGGGANDYGGYFRPYLIQ